MPRTLRRNVSGSLYHLIPQFVDRDWYITSEHERDHYLQLLGEALAGTDWRCLGFAVMSNHVHLAMRAGEEPLHAWVRAVHAPFAEWMNKRHHRIGPLFVRGPKEFLIPPARVRNVIAYIHNNPVRAGVVGTPSESRWTSHRAYAELDAPPRWLDVALGLDLMGFSAATSFHTWAATPAARPSADDLRAPVECRQAPDRNARVGREAPVDAGAIVGATARHLGIRVEQLRSRRRGLAERLAREVAIHCAQRLGIACNAIASALCISQQGESVIRRRSRDSDLVREISDRVLARVDAAGK